KIEGVDQEIADNIRSYLTLTRYVTRDDLNDGQVRRLADKAVDEAADAMRPYGYYAPTIRNRTTRDEPDWIVRLRIQPNDPVKLQVVDLQLAGAGRDDPELKALVATSPLKVGDRLVHPTYDLFKADLMRTAQERGYLDARFTRRELLVNTEQKAGEVHLELDTGGRYEFGAITIEQDVLEPDVLRGYVRFAEGQPYSTEKLHATQYALEDSNYYAQVSVTPGDRDPATLTVPVTIRGEKIKRDRYALSAGYGTDTGARGQFSWDNRRANTLGHRMRVELTASQIKQELVGRYLIPIGDPSLEKLEFSTGYVNEDIGDLRSQRYEFGGGLTQVYGRWQRVLFLKLSQERTIVPGGPDTNSLLLIPGISYASLPPNFLTGWVRDAAYYFELSGSPSSLGSGASYLRFYTRGERVWPMGDGPWHLRLRGELGASWVDQFSELPASQRFFAGGDRSVRGFAINSLSPPIPPTPDNPNGNTSGGGENKLVGSVEFERDFRDNLRGAVFFDTGNAFNNWNTPLEYSIGIGVRWKLPMLMIGLDLAQALSEKGQNPRIHLNITQVL
ncbi:MAG TPA: BamA/TamA family outer membrane protein, partial [Steroidobacteraceae bacterium]